VKHLLDTETLSPEDIHRILETTEAMLEISQRDIKKVPTLRGRTVINMFLEPSTRTRVSFEIAAKRLSADAINVGASGSSLSKAETLSDMARNLSGGMKRRLMIARALVHEPRLLLPDEPTAGVDIEIRRSMWTLLRSLNEAGMTIILTTHYLEEAESLCRNIAIIDEGRIIENDSMMSVVRKLQREAFVLTLRESVAQAPTLNGYDVKRRNEHEIEVEVTKEHSLNDLFQALSAQGLNVTSMRTRSNRLEELFIRLVDKSQPGAADGRR